MGKSYTETNEPLLTLTQLELRNRFTGLAHQDLRRPKTTQHPRELICMGSFILKHNETGNPICQKNDQI